VERNRLLKTSPGKDSRVLNLCHWEFQSKRTFLGEAQGASGQNDKITFKAKNP
jgi:hypothetical protein